MRSTLQAQTFSEQSYCSPWNLKIQEEKFQQISSACNPKPLHRTYSARPLSRKPPALPPLPPGGLIPSRSSSTSKSPLNHRSLPKIRTAYDRPWDVLKTSLINNLHGKSLQKLPQHCSTPTVSSCQHPDDSSAIPIDRYFWYHYAMSRRQAENILESRSSGSFLVRQSESGNQNDYSLSIQTTKGCVHMRISYFNGFYILGECSRPFASVASMIKYFSHTSVPIRGATHMKLGLPVLRWEILSSSLSNQELL